MMSGLKKSVFHQINRSRVYNRIIEYRFRDRVENATADKALPFSIQVKYENALKRLPHPEGLLHPQNFFFNKANQRAFLESIGAPLVPVEYQGELSYFDGLKDGEYVIKPVKGCSARGVVPFDICQGKFEVNGKSLDLTAFKAFIKAEIGDDRLLVEVRVQDKYFGDLMDYKVYLFLVSGADHVICIQRSDGKTGATYSAAGKNMDIGKYRKKPLRDEPPAEAIHSAVELALQLQKKIPLSFVRLDFYVTQSGVYVGEITPIPGDSGQFYPAYDLEMGRKWMKSRLYLRQHPEGFSGVEFFARSRLRMF